ncbi:YhcH/YjgK/YiaL family protein [Geopsychrobacter electrodiphilus]|uniref:YhcH/YjgK/YiaL family protein n=1 Tax=Geopsychrobacter electrodiphilus TaxID=225196 RepID=UPI00037BC1AD|nr:YhcH/YjgK/YiaL family protein [Geopsychrobacter electrodiphilus]
MIVDRIENFAEYLTLGDRLARALDFLHRTDFAEMALGEHCLEGRDIMAIVNEYQLKPETEGRLEAHRNYIDIQYLVRGEERIGYAPLHGQPVLTPYDGQRDLIFYAGAARSMVRVEEGMFAIYYPHDLHMPGLGEPDDRVRKVVMKVRV